MGVIGGELIERLQNHVCESVTELAPRMRALAEEIHRDPELGGAEMHAVTVVSGELEECGFSVETGLAGFPTAFRAEIGRKSSPSVAFLAEYDAVPGLGHACGHNLIVAVAYGAAVALSRVLDRAGGRVLVIGAPAEETIGGKVVLAARGVFDHVDAALLAHPATEDRAVVRSLASWSVDVVFEGRSAHAVVAPEQGINALDAMIQLFVARDALLKRLKPEVRMPGIILEGGVRPNVVPARSRARFSLRAAEAGYLVDTVLPRFEDVVDGVARATGTRATVTTIDNLYDEFVANEVLAETYALHAHARGLSPRSGPGRPFGSLDMGTLSQRVPALHPLFPIADEPIPTHTKRFTDCAMSGSAFEAAQRACQALALTGLDLLVRPELLERARVAHARQTAGKRRREVPLVVEMPGC